MTVLIDPMHARIVQLLQHRIEEAPCLRASTLMATEPGVDERAEEPRPHGS
jgi:hypothetical protein